MILAEGDWKAAFYRELARATKNDERFREEIGKHKDNISDIKIYFLQLLREYARECGVEVRVVGSKATLCALSGGPQHGFVSNGEEIREVEIQGDAMCRIRWRQHLLEWFVGVMDIRGLEVARNTLDMDILGCIGDMKSLTKLDVSCCEIGPGSVSRLQDLVSLEELDFSYNRLTLDDVQGIAKIGSLVRLSIRCCGRTGSGYASNLQRLKKKLAATHASHSAQERLLLSGRISIYEGLNVVDDGDVEGSLEHLRLLGNLTELDVSLNRLTLSDMHGIGGIPSLAKLDMSSCSIEPGSLLHLQKLAGLAELDVSSNTLTLDDVLEIGKIQSLTKLSVRYCRVEAGGRLHLLNLRNRRRLQIDGLD